MHLSRSHALESSRHENNTTSPLSLSLSHTLPCVLFVLPPCLPFLSLSLSLSRSRCYLHPLPPPPTHTTTMTRAWLSVATRRHPSSLTDEQTQLTRVIITPPQPQPSDRTHCHSQCLSPPAPASHTLPPPFPPPPAPFAEFTQSECLWSSTPPLSSLQPITPLCVFLCLPNRERAITECRKHTRTPQGEFNQQATHPQPSHACLLAEALYTVRDPQSGRRSEARCCVLSRSPLCRSGFSWRPRAQWLHWKPQTARCTEACALTYRYASFLFVAFFALCKLL